MDRKNVSNILKSWGRELRCVFCSAKISLDKLKILVGSYLINRIVWTRMFSVSKAVGQEMVLTEMEAEVN